MAYQYGAPPGFGAPRPMQAPPAGMPANFDYSAPVIRLGTGGPSDDAPRRAPRGGLGSNAEAAGGGRNMERERERVRENMMALQPPTREEVARTIFVGGLGEDMIDDDQIEAILRCAGKLRRWTRVKDADDKKCKFGFAEYEDVDSLEAAADIFADGVEVPIKGGEGAEEESRMAKMLVVVDEQSKSYIGEWKSRGREDPNARQFRIDGCKEDLRQTVTSIANASAFDSNQAGEGADKDGDTAMANGTNGEPQNGEVVTIPLTLEDELSDIPAEQRATVAGEIRAFRERSNKRDLDRLRKEEEAEQAERNRSGSRINRLASPPSNGVPSGPRGSHVAGAPAGPKGYRGAQLPQDYVNGVAFVGENGVNREAEDAEESDEELERRRQSKKAEELERQYLDAERKWQNRERTRAMAQERERNRDNAFKAEQEREKDIIAKRLKSWNDDEEARLGREEYYYDRSAWLRKRTAYREREEAADKRDRETEARERADEARRHGEAQGQADDFLDQMGMEIGQKQQQQQQQPQSQAGGAFKISLGSAAAQRTKAQPAQAAPRRGMGDVEDLLEDEEDAAASGARPSLKPLTDLSTVPTDLTEDEKASGRRQLAGEIPTDPESLFSWPLQWQHITPEILQEQIRPFVEKKVVEYLGVQDDFLVDSVVEGLQKKRGAEQLVRDLEEVLEDETRVLMRKVWRLVVFWAEAGARGFV